MMNKKKLSYPKNKIKVLLLENIHPISKLIFEREGYKVETISSSLSDKELIKKIENISIIGIRSKTKINKKILLNANRLLAIGAFCNGTNQAILGEDEFYSRSCREGHPCRCAWLFGLCVLVSAWESKRDESTTGKAEANRDKECCRRRNGGGQGYFSFQWRT